MCNLAIIIPAYKDEYLEETLFSLSNQTDKRFRVYIGDDCSPYNLKNIVSKFSDSLNILYHRFEQNLGGTSLTKQWERCVELSSEEWIWLFSDDDIIQEDAVEVFYQSLGDDSLFYKFNTRVIDEQGEIELNFSKFDKMNHLKGVVSTQQFIKNRLACNGFRSYAVEYIFHRSLYKKNKFVELPLAWGADDATWFLYSISNKETITVLDSVVFWRFSGINISSDVTSVRVVSNKIEASISYVRWMKEKTKSYGLEVKDSLLLDWLCMQLVGLNAKINFLELKDFAKEAALLITPLQLITVYIMIFKKRVLVSFIEKLR